MIVISDACLIHESADNHTCVVQARILGEKLIPAFSLSLGLGRRLFSGGGLHIFVFSGGLHLSSLYS